MRAKLTAMRNETFIDVLRSVTNKRPPKRHPAQIARGLVALECALQMSDLRRTEFARRFVDGPGRSKSALLFKWLAGETVPSRQKILQIDQAIPGTLHLYDHPFFDLLADLPLSVREVAKCLSQFTLENPFGQGWRYQTADTPGPPSHVPRRNDTGCLRDSHDLNSTAILLGLVREAEALGRTLDHMTYIAEFYRSLPSILSIPWFRTHRALVCWCIERLHCRDPLSFHLLKVRWSVIERLEQSDVQSKMSDLHFRFNLWRCLDEADIDVVEYVHLREPQTLAAPLPSISRAFIEKPTPRPGRRGSAHDMEQKLRAILG